MQSKQDNPKTWPPESREFQGRVPETEAAFQELCVESQAALRQFSLERMMGYGVDYADAIELRARVISGRPWLQTATELADECLEQIDLAGRFAQNPTKAGAQRRASALLRMSQMMFLEDNEERAAIYSRAASLYAQAFEPSGGHQRLLLDTANGPMAGWLISAGDQAVASAVVIGGIEGWAMDFDSLGEALAARGIDALLLDGPGQGETRLLHRHHLNDQWSSSYKVAIDFLNQRAPGRPIGFSGNSMGGSFAMAVAAADARIRACCNNGGVIAPWMVPQSGAFFSKMVAFCGIDPQQSVATWSTVTPAATGPNAGYPLLVLQGGKDPLVTQEMAQMMLSRAPTEDKKMTVFLDGDHCLYNHKSDRDALIADWMRARMLGA